MAAAIIKKLSEVNEKSLLYVNQQDFHYRPDEYVFQPSRHFLSDAVIESIKKDQTYKKN